jgi:hypothetical protein
MGAHVAIEHGRHPWLPSEDAELVETLHHYGIPLVGVVLQGGALHLFRCIEGHDDPKHVWTYIRITEEDLQALRGAGPDELDTMVEGLGAGRPTVVALGYEGRGLMVSVLLANPVESPSLLDAAGAALRDARDELDAMVVRFVTG